MHFLLGPATVALAVPLYRQVEKVRRSGVAILVGLLAGSLTAVLSAIGVVWLLGGGRDSIVSIAPKSVTAPGHGHRRAARRLAVAHGGACHPDGIKDWAARGFAIGVASHGIGTARALQVNEIAGAFAGLGMGLNALATSILVPVLWHLLLGGR